MGESQKTAEVLFSATAEPLPDTYVAPHKEVPAERTTWEPPSSTARPGGDSSLRYAALAALVSLIGAVALALPLLHNRSQALLDESLRRGEVLAELLAATDQAALVEARRESLGAAGVAEAPGVVGAFILSPSGEVLYSSPNASPPNPLDGLGVQAADLRSPRRFATGDGVVVFVTPVKGEGRRVGIAALRYDPSAGHPGGTVPLVALGSLLLVLGVFAAGVLARRWTLSTIENP